MLPQKWGWVGLYGGYREGKDGSIMYLLNYLKHLTAAK